MRALIAESVNNGIGTIRRSPFARNAVALSLATVAGQGLMLAASPFLSRLYTPADFGVLALYSSSLSVLLSVCSLRYELAVPTADSDEAAIDLMHLAGYLVVATGMLAFVAYLSLRSILPRSISAASAPYLWILPIGVVGGGLFQALSYWSIRQRDVRPLSQARVAQNASQAIIQLFGGLVSVSPQMLLLGDALGRSIGAGTLVSGVPARSQLLRRRRIRSMLSVARRFKEYPLLMTGAALLNITALQVPLLLIPTTFGVTAAGVYFLAYRVLVMPTTTVGTAVGQVFLGEAASSAHSSVLLRGKSLKLARVLMIINGPIFVAVVCAGSTLFATVFGAKWTTAGLFAQILSPMALLWSLANPLSGLLLVGKRLKESLFFSAADLAVKVVGIVIGKHFENIYIAIAVVSATGTILCSVSIWRFLRVAGIGFIELAGELGKSMASSVPLAIATLAALALRRPDVLIPVVAIMLPVSWLLGWYTRVLSPRV